MNQRPLVLAMTGASGSAYAVRLLQLLLANGREVHLVISPSGATVIKQELDIDIQPGLDALLNWSFPPSWTSQLRSRTPQRSELNSEEPNAGASGYGEPNNRNPNAGASGYGEPSGYAGRLHHHSYTDYFTPIASGSHLTEAMIVCPCSGSTLSGIVRSASGNLIERAAEVHLKERRPLIVVPRETPLSTFQLENMLRASQAGIVVLPAAPGWYHGVHCLADLVDFVVARILDQLQIPHQLMHRWAE